LASKFFVPSRCYPSGSSRAARILDCGGRAQRRHRFSTANRASKATWRFVSRRSPKKIWLRLRRTVSLR
jgi:hypothetical protein